MENMNGKSDKRQKKIAKRREKEGKKEEKREKREKKKKERFFCGIACLEYKQAASERSERARFYVDLNLASIIIEVWKQIAQKP